MEYAVPHVNMVRLFWQMPNGMRAAKMVPYKEYIKDDFEIHICTGALFSPICYNQLIPGCGEIDKQVYMRPDRSTFKVLPWSPTQASVMVDFFTHDGERYKYCPRSTVRKAIIDLKEKHGLEVKIGFELEFAIFNLEFSPVEYNVYSSSNSLDLYAGILEEIVLKLQAMDIEVLVVHKETGPGQYEVVLGYGEILETLDKYFMARELIKAVLRKYSLIGSFIPKSGPITQNGAHVHMSLWKDGRNITVNKDLTYHVGE